MTGRQFRLMMPKLNMTRSTTWAATSSFRAPTGRLFWFSSERGSLVRWRWRSSWRCCPSVASSWRTSLPQRTMRTPCRPSGLRREFSSTRRHSRKEWAGCPLRASSVHWPREPSRSPCRRGRLSAQRGIPKNSRHPSRSADWISQWSPSRATITRVSIDWPLSSLVTTAARSTPWFPSVRLVMLLVTATTCSALSLSWTAPASTSLMRRERPARAPRPTAR
mmetsp:Transcript_116791/g.164172  ORF Transcript_116791/g.164172 Transcript_116791/m.164172 type:complete len:221 (-) Transcript_116791:1429-2091(-)